MNTKWGMLVIALFSASVFALTVQDVAVDARVENGTTISGAGDAQVTGSYLLQWVAVTQDVNDQPITVHQYEVRYKATDETVYTLVTVSPQLTEITLVLGAGSYSGFIQAVDSNGRFSEPQNFSFTVM